MFELIAMSLLGVAFINACAEERKQEAQEKEAKRIHALKMKVFHYAISNQVSYNSVVEDLQKGKLTFAQIDAYLERKSHE